MYKIIISAIRKQKGIFAGTFISIVLAIMLMTACTNLMFSSIDGLRSGNGSAFIGAISLFGTLTGITVFAAVYVIVGTASFSIQQRYSNIALLRGMGLTPGQIKRMMSAEMNIILLAGYALGAPLGLALAPAILNQFTKMGAVPEQFPYSINTLNMLIVFGSAWVILQLAAYISAKSIAVISPVEAFREAAIRTKGTGPVRWIIGLIFTFGAVAILMFVPQAGAAGIGYNFLASLCFIIGVSVLGDVVVKLISIIIRSFLRLFGPIGYLAVNNSERYAYRQANAALGIVLMIALNGGILMNSLVFNQHAMMDAANLKTQNAVIYMMILISMSFSVIAVINTFFTTIASRKAEYRNLWLIGMTEGQIKGMLSIEVLTVVAAGVILGGAINTACVAVFYRANGFGTAVFGNPAIYFSLIGAGLIVGLAAGIWAIRHTVSRSAGRIRYE